MQLHFWSVQIFNRPPAKFQTSQKKTKYIWVALDKKFAHCNLCFIKHVKTVKFLNVNIDYVKCPLKINNVKLRVRVLSDLLSGHCYRLLWKLSAVSISKSWNLGPRIPDIIFLKYGHFWGVNISSANLPEIFKDLS